MEDHNFFPLKVWLRMKRREKKESTRDLLKKKKKRYVCVGQGDIVYPVLFT